jgi:hypothetical protein
MTITQLAEIYSQHDRFSVVNSSGQMFAKPCRPFHSIALMGMCEKVGRHIYSWRWRNPVYDRAELVASPQNMTYRWRRI